MKILQLLHKAHLLSLDVVIGAMVCHVIFQKLPSGNGAINWFTVVILGLVVFCIYVADRLLDNRKAFQPDTERHQFHAQNQAILIRFVLFCGLVSGVLVFFLPKNIIQFGVIVGSLSAIYLWIASRVGERSIFNLLKEPITALVYTSAVFGTAIISKKEIAWLDFGIGFIFLLIAFQNLLLFSYFEFQKEPNSYSLASFWGNEATLRWIQNSFFFILILGLGFVFFSETLFQKRLFFVEILMSLSLWQITRKQSFFVTNDRYRWVGDAVFLLPLIIV